MSDDRPLPAWAMLARRCPYDLLDGILVERAVLDSASAPPGTAGELGQGPGPGKGRTPTASLR
jgi:hypothetical protein